MPVPCYFYHQALEDEFKAIFQALQKRRIRTQTISDVLEESPSTARSVILSFDDGWSSVWSIAFPLAERYDARFTLFVCPELIHDGDTCRSTLDDGEHPAVLNQRDRGAKPMLNWAEIRAMHASGRVDIQSHTSNHGVVFASDNLKGFAQPDGPFPLNGMTPCILRADGEDKFFSRLPPGTPIYDWEPALASGTRYLDCERTREQCVRLVSENGGSEFFRRNDWKKQLTEICRDAPGPAWESDDERALRLRRDLQAAKTSIEAKLDGKQIRVVAPPWALMHPDFPRIAAETGHDLVVLGYPFPTASIQSDLPVFPRLYGDSIWALIYGPFLGGVGWLRARKRAMARVAAGAIP